MAETRKRIREKPEVRRARIIGEAFRIIGEFGYHGFTVQGLAERCGLTNAGLLHYFGSKDDLLLALLDEVELRGEEYVTPLVVALDHDAPGPDEMPTAIVRIMCAMIEPVVQHPEEARFVFVLRSEAMEPSHPAHNWFMARDRETIDLLVHMLGALDNECHPVARQLVAALNGLVGQWLQSNMEFNLMAEAESMFSLILTRPFG
ncbi:MAG: helix-turn-helix domain-containing protein [Sphingomonadaceae bacterium]